MSAKIIRIFTDSNVWFSALWGSANCQKILEAHQDGKIKIVISDQVLAEVTRNILKKIPSQASNLENLLLIDPPEIVPGPEVVLKRLITLISPNDLPIFIAALEAKVDYFVTGNTKDFQVKKLQKLTKISVVKPKEMVEVLGL